MWPTPDSIAILHFHLNLPPAARFWKSRGQISLIILALAAINTITKQDHQIGRDIIKIHRKINQSLSKAIAKKPTESHCNPSKPIPTYSETSGSLEQLIIMTAENNYDGFQMNFKGFATALINSYGFDDAPSKLVMLLGI
jgi:hypothetical protein